MSLRHFWIVGPTDLLVWIDKQFLKSLEQAVPDLDRLLAEPARRLSEEPITIGPRKKYVATLLLGFALAIPNWMWILVLFASFRDDKKGPLLERPDGPFLLALLLGVVLGVLVGTTLVAWWILRGGQMMLTSEGVELRYRQSVVSCPWSLFLADGEPLKRGAGDVLLPVQPKAVPLVELYQRGNLRAQGKAIKSRQLRFKGRDRALISGLYIVRTIELAELLISLGNTLGNRVSRTRRGMNHD